MSELFWLFLVWSHKQIKKWSIWALGSFFMAVWNMGVQISAFWNSAGYPPMKYFRGVHICKNFKKYLFLDIFPFIWIRYQKKFSSQVKSEGCPKGHLDYNACLEREKLAKSQNHHILLNWHLIKKYFLIRGQFSGIWWFCNYIIHINSFICNVYKYNSI